MKKTFLALTGIFALVSCSDESINENFSPSENSVIENGVRTVTNGPGFNSPYDETMYGNHIPYIVGNSTPYFLEITPYIGLAYHDGIDDGYYNNPNLTAPIDLINGDFPNLYAGQTEYLNLIQGPTISFDPMSGYHDISSVSHCPTLSGEAFDIQSLGATSDEAQLLAAAGKVYYVDITIKNILGVQLMPTQRLKHIFHPVNTDTPLNSFGDWEYLGINVPGHSEPFYFNVNSKEITSGTDMRGAAASADDMNFVLGGNNYNIHYHSNYGGGNEGLLILF